MTNPRLTYLFQRLVEGAATSQEKDEWSSIVNIPGNEPLVKALIGQYLKESKAEEQVSPEATAFLLHSIFQAEDQPVARTLPAALQWRKWAPAAAIIAGLITVALYRLQRKDAGPAKGWAFVTHVKNDALPGTDKALLTLGDGSIVSLDSNGNKVMNQSGVSVTQRNGQLQYRGTAAGAVVCNILTTPRGCQFRITLPDGTKVWLNAASSLRYPVVFTGNDRTVELAGEGYFEVAKDPSKPFHVKAGDISVNVLGTHFNIMAYPDEPGIKTTLSEGLVKVTSSMESKDVSPGQQAFVNHGSAAIEVGAADVEEALAWKDGYFVFRGADLPVLLRQFGRWYNIDIVYRGENKTYEFMGKIPRTAHLSSILKLFDANNIPYEFDGDRLIIHP